MRIYADSLLERKVTKLTQELKSLKTGQRYLVGQTMGYVSDSVNVNTKIYEFPGTSYGYGYNCFRIKFIGDHLDRTVIGDLKIKGIRSNGVVVNLVPFVMMYVSDYESKPALVSLGQKRTEKKNEIEFYVCIVWGMTSDSTISSLVRGSKVSVSCVSNDTGHLVVTQEYTDS